MVTSMARTAAKTTPSISSADQSYLKNFQILRAELTNILHNKSPVIETTLCALISGGHLLLEDVPGVGKTTFIKALAKMLNLNVSRIQFTSDLLPSDIIGVEIFNLATNSFEFHKGPVFANVVMADELNRASPRTQSALLEAMGEGMVSVDRKTYELPQPFTVFASQNPTSSIGTYDIPESQMDRFSALLRIGYPDAERERQIFLASTSEPLKHVPPGVISREDLIAARNGVEDIHISDAVVNYVKNIVDASRTSKELRQGISTRGGVSWIRMAKAKALLDGRGYVIPDDLQSLAVACLAHRVVPAGGVNSESAIKNLLRATDI
jgi:MoxR-like ATPase